MGGQMYGLVGISPSMERVFDQVRRYAASSVPILILGETGTGKNLCAHAVWKSGGRSAPVVSINCAAIPESLVETELFGHRKGAFTGADRDHLGYIGRADGGTLFLDEITSLSLHTQARLLWCIEEGTYLPVGAEQECLSEFRLLAAAHPDLDRRVENGTFREDLYHRLGAVRIHLPSLRERPDDIPVLVDAFLTEYREREEVHWPRAVSPEGMALLTQAVWPGNVRQLRNVVEAAATAARAEEMISPEVILEFLPMGPAVTGPGDGEIPTLEAALRRATRDAILAALGRTRSDPEEAARLLGIGTSTLYRKIAELREASLWPLDRGTGEDDS